MIRIKATHFLHSIFVTLFIYTVFHSIQGFIECYNIERVKEYDLRAATFSLNLCQSYRTSLFLLIPILGILVKRKIGWILIASYIYFVLINFIIQNLIDNILFLIISTTILLALLLFMNTGKSILVYYNITAKNIITINTIALLFGTCFSYLLIILKHH